MNWDDFTFLLDVSTLGWEIGVMAWWDPEWQALLEWNLGL